MNIPQYRAFNKTEKRMYEVLAIEWRADPQQLRFLTLRSTDELHSLRRVDCIDGSARSYEIMASVGINDKHGDVIYEDDIVKLGLGAVYDDIYFRILWDEHQLKYMASQVNEKQESMVPIAHFQHDIEIIGNIWQQETQP